MAGIAEDEIVEHTLTQIQECYLFELPPRVRAQGWLAADMTKQMWTGRMRVVQRGKEAAIMLIDRRDGKLFAMCKVGDGAVERVPDSSRYFVIKIQNAQGRHAFVGLAFDDRNQAFDFNVALQEFKKDMERSTMLEKGGSAGGEGEAGGEGDTDSRAPKVDLSLKQGEKIKISIGGGSKRTSSRPRRTGGGGGGLALAPPPGDTARKAGGGVGLLAPPPGDTRRARGVSKPSSPLYSPPPAPAPAAVAAPSGGLMTLSQSSSSGFSGGGGGGSMGSNSGSSPPVSAGGGRGGDGGLLGMMSSGNSSAAGTGNNGLNAYPTQQQQQQQQQQHQEDDDPFGLGLGSASSSTPAPPQVSSFSSPPPSAGGWGGGGLSDMSGLGAGLPPASGGMGPGSMPSQQQPQQSGVPTNMGYPSTDPFAQPQQGFPSPAAPPAGGGQQSAPVNDLLDGLF